MVKYWVEERDPDGSWHKLTSTFTTSYSIALNSLYHWQSKYRTCSFQLRQIVLEDSLVATKETNIETKLRLLTKAVAEHYYKLGDQTSPSVVVSQLPNEDWYTSVVRYTGAMCAGKEVVINRSCSSLENSLESLALGWLAMTTVNKKSAREQLAEHLGK